MSWGSATIKLTKIYNAEEINKSLQKQNKAVLLKQINEVEGQIINVSFSLLKNSQGVKVISQISRYDLYSTVSINEPLLIKCYEVENIDE